MSSSKSGHLCSCFASTPMWNYCRMGRHDPRGHLTGGGVCIVEAQGRNSSQRSQRVSGLQNDPWQLIANGSLAIFRAPSSFSSMKFSSKLSEQPSMIRRWVKNVPASWEMEKLVGNLEMVVFDKQNFLWVDCRGCSGADEMVGKRRTHTRNGFHRSWAYLEYQEIPIPTFGPARGKPHPPSTQKFFSHTRFVQRRVQRARGIRSISFRCHHLSQT